MTTLNLSEKQMKIKDLIGSSVDAGDEFVGSFELVPALNFVVNTAFPVLGTFFLGNVRYLYIVSENGIYVIDDIFVFKSKIFYKWEEIEFINLNVHFGKRHRSFSFEYKTKLSKKLKLTGIFLEENENGEYLNNKTKAFIESNSMN
jgi:hypothetical protein